MEISPEAVQRLVEATFYLVFHFTKAVTTLVQRESFLYWPFVVSSVVIAALAWRWTVYVSTPAAERRWRKFFSDYFSAKIWWHRSARADYVLYFANALVLPLVFGYLLVSEIQIAAHLQAWFGASTAATGEAPGVATRLLFTIAFFVAYDFGRFVSHSLLHDVPLLWEFHKIHHSAEVLTPMTTYRAHPVDLLIMAWGPVLLTGLLTWSFNPVAAAPVSVYTFLGVHALMWGFNLIGNLRHSPVWLSYGPRIGRWLISPAHHQLHHSYEPRHLGCNRGFELAIWDRLYGTLYVPPKHAETFRMGVGDETDGRYHTLGRMYFWPFAGAARTSLGKKPQMGSE